MQIITTHKNTDFDALSSLVAANLLYPDAIPVLPGNINHNVKDFISLHKDMFSMHSSGTIDLDRVDTLIVVDTNKWERLERFDALKDKKNLKIILWDHHPQKGNIDADIEYFEEMGANITLIIKEIKKRKKKITPIQATLFLTGLYEDTGSLTFPSTKVEDFYAAAYLVKQKADLNILSKFLRPAYGKLHKDILFEMLQKAERIKVNGYNISINILELRENVDSLAVVVNMYREILNVDAAFCIFINKKSGRCIIIGRSNLDDINIGSIMKSMGGGGHPGAGSAMLKSVSPNAIEEMIVELLQGDHNVSVRVSDLMSFPVFSVSSKTSMEKTAKILRDKGCTGIPVVDDKKIVGIISRRDFRKLRKDSHLKAPVKAFMSTKVITIEPDKSPIQAAKTMVKYDIGRLPVVENQELIGIITRSDNMMYFYDSLPA